MTPSPEAIATALNDHIKVDGFNLPGRSNHIQAATLLPLRWRDGLSVIATVRSSKLRQHAGEVCFPGGTPDNEHETLRETAIREAEEELGIVAPTILGRLSKMPVYTSAHRITPWVGAISETRLVPAAGEVSKVLDIPIRPLLQRTTLEGLPFPMPDGIRWSPVFHMDGHIIYGATAHTLLELLEVLAPLYGTRCPPLAKGSTEWADILPPKWAAGLPG